MPTRTPEARALIKSLPKKVADKHCNARTPTGYCRLPAGFDTDHPQIGRCKFHGGRAGRNIVHGMYSKHLTSTIKKEFEKLVNNPVLVDLTTELAVMKTMLSSFLRAMQEDLGDRSFWIQKGKNGFDVSAKANSLFKIMESLTKLYGRIVDAENKSQQNLKPRDIINITNQTNIIMNTTCGGCPVRAMVGDKLQKIKMPNAVEDLGEAQVVNENK